MNRAGNRLVTSLLPALLALLATACATTGRSAALGEPVTLAPGEQVALPQDATLRYSGVTADSRCAPDVQCIRAGDADVAFQFNPGSGAASTVLLNTADAPVAIVGAWRLRLLSLEFGPSPRVTVRVDGGKR